MATRQDLQEAVMRNAVKRGEQLLLEIFRYRYAGHRSAYRATYLEPYMTIDRAPVSMNVAESTAYTLLTNGRTLRFFLPIFAETATRHDKLAWTAHREVGTCILRYDTYQRIFSLHDDSPLVRLAKQYGVSTPRSLGVVRPRQMRAFFDRLQTAVYDAAASDPVFANSVKYDYFNSNETLYKSMEYALDQFLRVSLFAQSCGTALTWGEYKVLYADRFNEPDMTVDSSDRWDHTTSQRLRAQILILNNLLTGNPEDLKPFLTMHMGMLKDLYANDANDTRLARQTA